MEVRQFSLEAKSPLLGRLGYTPTIIYFVDETNRDWTYLVDIYCTLV